MFHRYRFSTIGLMAGLAVATSSQPLAAQPVECDPCLEVIREVRLSSRLGIFTPSTSQSVLRTPDGRYLVSHRMGGSPAIAVYDSAGGWIRLYDREGGGPGEFRHSPRLLPGPAGSIYAADGYRTVEFDATLTVLSTKRTDLRADLAYVAGLQSGAIVVSQDLTTDGGVLYDVSLLGPDGSLVKPVQRADKPPGVPTVVAPSASGGFWTLSIADLRLREYSDQGKLLKTVMIQNDWFVPWEEPREGEGRLTRPRPRHAGLQDPGDGTLILVTAMADREWRTVKLSEGGMINLMDDDQNSRWDSVVQLLDAGSGEVLAHRRLDEAVRPIRGAEDLLLSVHTSELGHVETQVWKVAGPS